MHKPLRTLLLASLLCLPGALFARTATPFAHHGQETNMFAAWMPNQLRQTSTDVNLLVYLPYSGTHNYWNIEFRSLTDGSGLTYYFTTDDNVAASNQLGSLPAGKYDVFYYAIYGPNAYFDFYAGCDQTSQNRGSNYGATFGCIINDDCNAIIIDKY